jgi:hypothetical protein
MLVSALKLTKQGEYPFADVSADKWYARAVSTSYAAGIIAGMSSTSFAPKGWIHGRAEEQSVAMGRS